MILFLIPYIPIPRIFKRIELASKVSNPVVVYWDRGTDIGRKIEFPPNVKVVSIYEKANEGNPFKRVFATIRFSTRAYKILKKEKPKCIHTTKTDMLLLTWIFKNVNKTDQKLIFEVSDIHPLAMNNKKNIIAIFIKQIIKLVEYLGSRQIDYLIVTSKGFWYEYYKKWIDKNKMIFIPNIPNTNVFREYKKKNKGIFTVGFIGKIRYVEKIKMLIDAAENTNVKVMISGNGIGFDEIIKYSLNKNFVQINGAYNYNRDISKLYSQVDCIYSVYDSDLKNVQIALPNRLYEAAFCELPLIVSKHTELANIVENEGIGVSVSDNDTNNLIEAINYIKQGIASDLFSENCRRFNMKYDYEKITNELLGIYKNC